MNLSPPEEQLQKVPRDITRLCKNPIGAHSSAKDDRFCLVSFHLFSVADLLALFKRNAVNEACRRTSKRFIALTSPVIRNLLDVMH
jgi:hypothetical protein